MLSNRSGSFVLILVAVALVLSGCSSDEAPPATAATPDEAVVQIARGLADGRPQVAWHALPESYQQDVTDLVHEAAAQMDAELWNGTFGVLKKLTRLLKEKQQFILDHPMIAGQLEDRDEVEANWHTVVGLFEVIVNSELSDLETVKKLDVERFLAGTGAQLMEQLAAASAMTQEDTWGDTATKLRATKATVMSSSGDAAVVRVEQPGEAPKEEEYVRLEGKWIPKHIADEWPNQIAEARRQLQQFSGAETEQNKQAILMQMAIFDGALDRLLETDSADEFNAQVGGLIGMAMGAAMAQASSGAWGRQTDSGSGTVTPSQPAKRLEPALAGAFAMAPAADPTPTPSRPLEITVGNADQFVGERIRVVTKDGLDTDGTLVEAKRSVLTLERQVGGGTMSFEVPIRDISSLELVGR